MSLQYLSVKRLRAIWHKRYATVTALNKKLKMARRSALTNPNKANQAKITDLESQVSLATDKAIEARDALENAKYVTQS